ncbi:VOC family protein [Alteromonas sp. PRIM-21]|uniref:VOC family protein n=1 Tax=Alteromonas sp. PRIM-21 TaxID=1454978 RepID=UPI0022B94D02|nr:VOC family protein [Alteromonas sp. PRIM-21]MCZ8530744.1 VOC family protein [Alteromonas sp. PRIM-21]
MKQLLSAITFFVDDYDNAIEYFTTVLNFTLTEDKATGEDSRFVLVTPPNSSASLLLAQAKNDVELELIGNQAADKVFLILNTDDFWRDFNEMQSKGVVFLETPREEVYGTVAIFKDKFGNKWDLIQTTE